MSLNKVMLIGRLGKDPEIRHTQSNVPVATFSIATDETYKDKEGNKVEKTEWHNIVAWRQLADICKDYVKKGQQIYVEGKMSTRNYQDKDNNTKYITEIVADSIRLLGSRGDGGATTQRDEPYQSSNNSGLASTNANNTGNAANNKMNDTDQNANYQPQNHDNSKDSADDLPF
ncbi:MAG: single-stranded DNA-binding protein [Bacteroidota bacterium]|nr:single-stranded DNA-binding protein [Bacteroidota bacterium]